MGRNELAKYRTMLEKKLKQLGSLSSKRADIAVEKTPDLIDEVQLLAERELTVRNLNWESGLSREIEAALERIHDGSYGQCLGCDEAINPRRLDAVPWTPYCMRCQEAAERGELPLSEAPAAEPVGWGLEAEPSGSAQEAA